MKMKKALAILLAVTLILSFSTTGVFAATDTITDYLTENNMLAEIVVGAQTGVISNVVSDATNLSFTVTPESGQDLLSHTGSFERYFIWSEGIEEITADDLVEFEFKSYTMLKGVVTVSGSSLNYVITFTHHYGDTELEFSEDRRAPINPWQRDPDITQQINVTYGKRESILYTVRVESDPAGVATFSGYGTGFADGAPYTVAITSQTPGYTFTGWQDGSTGNSISGNIPSADVDLKAYFTKDEVPLYTVAAESDPAGVATFSGTGSGFHDGDTYLVAIDTVTPGYTFTGWTQDPNGGNVPGRDVLTIANFVKDEPQPEPEPEPETEEIIDIEPEVIPEELPETGGIPMAGFFGFGALLSGFGLVIRKKK